VLWGTVFTLGGLRLLRWSCGSGRPRGRHVLIHPIELRLQLNQFSEFLRRWQRRSSIHGELPYVACACRAVLAGSLSPLPSSNTMKNLVFPGTETTMFSLKARLCISCSPASPAFDAMRSRNKMLLSSWPLALQTHPARRPGRPPSSQPQSWNVPGSVSPCSHRRQNP